MSKFTLRPIYRVLLYFNPEQTLASTDHAVCRYVDHGESVELAERFNLSRIPLDIGRPLAPAARLKHLAHLLERMQRP